jgi:hypothetical protein
MMNVPCPSHFWLVALLAIGCGSDRGFAPDTPDVGPDVRAMDGGNGGAPGGRGGGATSGGNGGGTTSGGSGGGGGAPDDARPDGTVRPDASIDASMSKYCVYDLDKYDSDCVYAP